MGTLQSDRHRRIKRNYGICLFLIYKILIVEMGIHILSSWIVVFDEAAAILCCSSRSQNEMSYVVCRTDVFDRTLYPSLTEFYV